MKRGKEELYNEFKTLKIVIQSTKVPGLRYIMDELVNYDSVPFGDWLGAGPLKKLIHALKIQIDTLKHMIDNATMEIWNRKSARVICEIDRMIRLLHKPRDKNRFLMMVRNHHRNFPLAFVPERLLNADPAVPIVEDAAEVNEILEVVDEQEYHDVEYLDVVEEESQVSVGFQDAASIISFICDLCGGGFTTKDNMKYHMNQVHRATVCAAEYHFEVYIQDVTENQDEMVEFGTISIKTPPVNQMSDDQVSGMKENEIITEQVTINDLLSQEQSFSIESAGNVKNDVEANSNCQTVMPINPDDVDDQNDSDVSTIDPGEPDFDFIEIFDPSSVKIKRDINAEDVSINFEDIQANVPHILAELIKLEKKIQAQRRSTNEP